MSWELWLVVLATLVAISARWRASRWKRLAERRLAHIGEVEARMFELAAEVHQGELRDKILGLNDVPGSEPGKEGSTDGER